MSVLPFRKPGWRSEDEILRDMGARLAELRAEAASVGRTMPCATCRWSDKFEAAWCHNPLVKGFGERVHMGMGKLDSQKQIPRLCGPEKALWQPQSFVRWHRRKLIIAAIVSAVCAYVLGLAWIVS